MTEPLLPGEKLVPRNRSCATCTHRWKGADGIYCRRHPPQVTQLMIGIDPLNKRPVAYPISNFPLVRDEWVCGEFTSKLVQ